LAVKVNGRRRVQAQTGEVVSAMRPTASHAGRRTRNTTTKDSSSATPISRANDPYGAMEDEL